jgi:hypothetical protein
MHADLSASWSVSATVFGIRDLFVSRPTAEAARIAFRAAISEVAWVLAEHLLQRQGRLNQVQRWHATRGRDAYAGVMVGRLGPSRTASLCPSRIGTVVENCGIKPVFQSRRRHTKRHSRLQAIIDALVEAVTNSPSGVRATPLVSGPNTTPGHCRSDHAGTAPR